MMRPISRLASALCLCLAACSPFPDIGPAPDAAAPMPQLLPLDQVLDAAPAARLAPTSGDQLNARAARLQQRAKAMQGDLADPATRARLRPIQAAAGS